MRSGRQSDRSFCALQRAHKNEKPLVVNLGFLGGWPIYLNSDIRDRGVKGTVT